MKMNNDIAEFQQRGKFVVRVKNKNKMIAKSRKNTQSPNSDGGSSGPKQRMEKLPSTLSQILEEQSLVQQYGNGNLRQNISTEINLQE